MLKKKIIFLLFVFVVMGVASGCSKVALQEESKKNEDNQVDFIEQNDLPTWPEEKFTEADYEGWVTYKNEVLGYEIKHPADWTVNDCDEGCASKEAIINPPDAEAFASYVSIGLDSRSLKEIRSVYLNPNNYEGRAYKEEEVSFLGMKAYHYFGSRYLNSDKLKIFDNGKIYSITVNNSKSLVFQIVSSFKFIN
jgi:hypothetical protein